MANTIEIVIKQSGSGSAIHDAGKALSQLGNIAGNATGSLGNFGAALGNVATVAGGIVVANLFGKITQGISGFITTGLNAVSSNQQLETSLKSLLTANHMYEQSTQTVTSAITKQLMSQDELGNKTAELTAQLNTQRATYQEQQERIRQLTEQYGENGLVVLKTKAQHEELGLSIQATEQKITALSATQTEYATTQQTVWQQTMSQVEAFRLAQEETKGLLQFVSELAVVSPFETETVEMTTKYAIAAGMGLDATKAFVPAFLDLAASVGITSESLGFAADQLFQVKKMGKLTEVDLRQLRRLGIDLGKVIGVEMGMSVEEFNKQAEKSPKIFDELFAAVTRFSQNTFAGTSKEMALSVKGLQSTLSDVFVIGSRTYIRPFVDAFTPAIAGMVGKLSNFVLGGDLAIMGQQAAQTLMSGIQRGLALFQAGGLATFSSLFGSDGIFLWTQIKTLIGNISDTFNDWGSVISGMLPSISTLSTGIIPTLINGLTFLNDHFEEFKGALLGVGAIMAGGIFVSLTAGLLALLTPVNLLIAGAALLGAAWAGNWGDIQGKTTEGWAIIQPILQQVYDWFMINIPLAIQATSNFWTNTLLPALTITGDWITGTLVPTLTNIYNWLAVNIPIGIQILSTFWTGTLLPAITVVGDWITTNLLPLFNSINNLMGVVLVKSLTILAGLWQNVLLPPLTKVWQMLQSNLMPIFSSLGEKVSGDIMPPLMTMAEEVLPMLSDGLETVTEWIKKATDFFNSLADAVSSFSLPDVLTPGSPPPMAYALMDIAKASGIAKSSIDALTQGVSNSSKTFAVMMTKTMHLQSQLSKNLMPKGQKQDITHLVQNLLPQFAGSFEAGQFGTGTLLQGIGQGLKAIGSKVGIGQVTDALNKAGLSLQNVTNQMSAAFIETQKVIRLQNAAKAVGVAGQLAQFGQAAADRLANKIETLQDIVDNGKDGAFEGHIISAAMAQDELNQALKEQAGIQQQIVDLQRQQADLQFLQQQISLIQMIKDAGLNVEEILGGMTLGLDASLPDIVTAMNNVVQAMIGKIDSDLQIQSPSKVMFKKFRDQIGGAAAHGLEAAKPMLQRAFNPILAPLTGSNTTSTRTTNNYFNQTVNTQADRSTVIADFNVMRGLVGA